MAKRNRRQPVDADVDMRGGLLAPGEVQITATGCAAADKNCVIALRQQLLHGIHALTAVELHAEVQDVARFLVNHSLWQPEPGYLRADETAGPGLAVEHGHLVAQRGQITRDRQRCRARPDAGHTLAVERGHFRHTGLDIVLVISGHTFEPADGHGLRLVPVVLLHTSPPTGWLARPVAGTSQHTGKDVGHPVDHVGVAVAPLSDQTDVFRNRGVGRAGPLAINNLVEIGRILDVGR